MFADAPGVPRFASDLRCCTYHPHLPAHLVGGILKSGEGAERIRARIAARVGVTPVGVGPPPAYAALPRTADSFGRDPALRCPFLDEKGERCSIWRHRGVACAAFHCKYDRGALGAGWWGLVVVAFDAIDRALARWVLERTGLDVAACDELLHHPGDEERDRRAWGVRRGAEEAHFLEAAALVEALDWDAIARIGGPPLAGLPDAMRGALARMDAIPARTRPSGELVQIRSGRAVTLRHPTVPFDPIEVPAELPPDPDHALLRRLLDWRVLVGVE
jgi:Fe-S-cluster containining protein